MEQPFKDIQEIITEHYGQLKNELYVERKIREETPYISDNSRIEYLEKLLYAYESLFSYLKNNFRVYEKFS